MKKKARQEPTEVAASVEAAQVSTATGVASLLPFPDMLQNVIIKAVLESRCERATDIWYEDKATQTVMVMRHGMQWQLNETANMIWHNLGTSVQELVGVLTQEYPDADPQEIQFVTLEFLLNASSYGLVDLLSSAEEESG